MPDDLTAIEKRPDSWRLNLADFGVVYKTTFAKGVISDFQKVQDDPLTVNPMVKVKGDAWGESDYIPLWFKPKSQYWDTPDHQAQDFNQGELYYENAWMSFRGGDEVKVLLQEGVPKMAFGFVDGVPRIGEDVLKLNNQVDAPYYIQCSKMTPDHYTETYSGQENGPDGKLIKLIQQAECILDTTQDLGTSYGSWDYISGMGLYRITIESCTDSGGQAYADITEYGGGIQSRSVTKQSFTIRHYLFSVGPILYCIQVIFSSSQSGYEIQYAWPNVNSVSGYQYASCADLSAYAASLDVLNETKMSQYPEGVHMGDPSGDAMCINVFAAPYLDKTYQDTKNSATTPIGNQYSTCDDFKQAYAGFTFQTYFTKAMIEQYWPDASESLVLEFFARPHTKAELQAAGMWPEGLS